ncbi:MAG: hypothetical protein AABX99_01625 [Nanoarchaeota archaeon]
MENKLAKILGLLVSSWIFLSFGNGKIYNDFQERIERNNKISEEYNVADQYLLSQNEKLQKTVDATKNNPLYYPFGLMYDLAKGRI